MNRAAVLSLAGCLVVAARIAASEESSAPPSGPDGAAPPNSSNPYAVIVDRNVFRLNPIPPPPAPEVPKADLPVIKLSGFLKIGTQTRALFSSLPKDKKDGPTYYNLADGEKDGILEVVRIHEDKGQVEIINSGTPATLSLKDDSLAADAAAAPPATPEHRFSPKSWGHNAYGGPGMGKRDFPAREQYQPPGGQPNMPFAFPMRTPRIPIPPGVPQ